jgi:hypothetical protein
MRTKSHSIKTFRRKTVDGETRTLCGRNYIVIPVVALVEGVRHAGGSPSPELVLSSSFGRHVETWNGRPIVVNHPVNEDGIAILASNPDVLESSYLGELLNAKLEDGKLVVEAWLDIAAIEDSSSKSVAETWSRLMNGATIEVSVGAIVYTANEKGKYKGDSYDGKWDIVIPDHLAFLDGDQIGACSVEDGCGTFRTQTSGRVKLSEGVIMSLKGQLRTVSSLADDEVNDTTDKNNSVLKTNCVCDTSEDEFSGNKALANVHSGIVKSLFGANTLDIDRRQILQRAITKLYPRAYVAYFNDNSVLYIVYDEQYNTTMYKLSYTSDGDDKVTITSDTPEEVIITSKITTVNKETKGKRNANKMSITKAVAKARKVSDEIDDEEEEETMESEEEIKPKKKKLSSSSALNSSLSSIATLEELETQLANSPVGRQLSQSLRIAKIARDKAIECILSSPAGKTFSKEDLATIDFTILDKMATTYRVATKVDGEEEESNTATVEETYDFSYLNFGNADTVSNKNTKLNVLAGKSDTKKAVDFSGRPGGRSANSPNRVPVAPEIFSFNGDGTLKE